MQVFLTLVRRELGSYFFSFSGYVVLTVVALMLGLSFSQMTAAMNGSPSDEPLTELFYRTMFFWLVILVASPAITMRSFALERSTGTFETLMTTPVRDAQVVLAKFTGAMIFYLILWAPLVVCLVLVRYFTQEPSLLPAMATTTAFLGIFLVGCLYISIGIFASAMTRNQIIAAMAAFAMGSVFFVASFFALTAPARSGRWARFFDHVSMIEHMQDFVRGTVDTRHVVFYISTAVWFLFMAVKAVESRRWK